jgi:hypothetical protein
VVSNIHARQDLNARNEQVSRQQRQGKHIVKGAINAIAHSQIIFLRLKVDVRGSGLYCLIYNKCQRLSYRGIANRIKPNFKSASLFRHSLYN